MARDKRQIMPWGKLRFGDAAPVIISLVAGGVAVVAQPLWAGQAPSAAFPAGVEATGNYQSAAGAITTAVRQVSINGGAWSATLTGARDPGELVAIRVLVTDSAGNTRAFPTAAGSTTLVQALPLPALATAPVITGGAGVGQSPAVTPAAWAAIPGTPAGMAREVEARLVVNGEVVTAPLAAGTAGGALRAQARARHTLGGSAGAWTEWAEAQSAAVTVQAGDTTPPTLVDVAAGAQSGDTIPIDLEGLSEAATVFWVLVPGGAAAPSVAQVIAGQNGSGGAPSLAGSFAAALGGGPYPQDWPLNGTFDLYVALRDGASNVSPAVYSALGIQITTALWNLVNNNNGTFSILSAPPPPPALTATNNGNGTFNLA